ncbi:MAG: peptidase [Acidobacteria bacterium]|nr:peptidase [Acidobacteriota bacterium]
MSRNLHRVRPSTGRPTVAAVVVAAVLGSSSVGAQPAPAPAAATGADATKPPETYVVRGGPRDGVSFFPRVDYPQLKPLVEGQLDFQHYHTYEETVALLRAWAERYPDLVELYSVGQSLEGRDLWQVTITNRKTGPHTDKPGFFIEGGRHAGEISGIEATLYFIDHVLTGYATDPGLRALVDTKALYARPHNNPDGASLYHYTAQTLRSTVRPYDNDGDGLVDEDPGEDLDGDGFIRQMRKHVGEDKGSFVKDPRDPKGRAMRRVAAGQGDWEVYPEGIDNDGDGRYNEDGVGGLDLHRNYPENWRPMKEATGRGYTQLGAGEYPLSEPETRAVFSFLMVHPNIAIVQSLDTAVPMLLRGPSTSRSEESMFPEDLALFRQYDEKGLEITGYPWAGDVYEVYATRLRTNPVTGEPLRPTPLFGHGPDFGYAYYGTIWYGNEIWNGGRFVDYDGDGRIDEWEVLRWHDEHRAGKDDFAPWTPFAHPQLGEVEIGGFNPKFYLQNPPPDLLEPWARNEALFNVHLALQLPQVAITDARVTPGTEAGQSVVEMTVANTGKMPTALEMAKRVKMVKPDTASIVLAEGQALVEAPEGEPRQVRDIELGWLAPGETKTVSWRVRGAGVVKLAIGSTRGGVDRRELTVP